MRDICDPYERVSQHLEGSQVENHWSMGTTRVSAWQKGLCIDIKLAKDQDSFPSPVSPILYYYVHLNLGSLTYK